MRHRGGGGYDRGGVSLYMELRAMHDCDFLWTTDRELRITTLSARLRDALWRPGDPSPLHVSELWQEDDPFGMLLLAHQWVLQGEGVAFDTERAGMHLHVSLEPLYDVSGAIAGVGGRATPGVGDRKAAWQLETLEEIERACGFGTWRTDFASGETRWSAGLFDLLGAEKSAAHNLRAFDHPLDAGNVARIVRDGEIAGTGYRCDHRIVRGDGAVRHVQEQAHVLYGEDGLSYAQVGSLVDITARKIARTSGRAVLEQRVAAALARARTAASGCAVLCLDVDGFKAVNERYGRPAGDEVLAAIEARLAHHVRGTDAVARLRGNAFLIILEDVAACDEAQYAARKILTSFETPFHVGGSVDCRVGVSIGVAVHPGCPGSAAALIDAAEREMTVVKRNGGRGIKIACESSSAGPSPLHTAANA